MPSVKHRPVCCATMVGLEPTSYERTTAFIPSGPIVTGLRPMRSGSRTHHSRDRGREFMRLGRLYSTALPLASSRLRGGTRTLIRDLSQSPHDLTLHTPTWCCLSSHCLPGPVRHYCTYKAGLEPAPATLRLVSSSATLIYGAYARTSFPSVLLERSKGLHIPLRDVPT